VVGEGVGTYEGVAVGFLVQNTCLMLGRGVGGIFAGVARWVRDEMR